MPWFSLLPAHLSIFETWIARLFILLGLLTIGPWATLIIYDVVLYCFRTVTYELPIIGGRARATKSTRAPQEPRARPPRMPLYKIGMQLRRRIEA